MAFRAALSILFTLSWIPGLSVHADEELQAKFQTCDQSAPNLNHIKYTKEKYCAPDKNLPDANKNCLKELDNVLANCLADVDATVRDKTTIDVANALSNKGGATNQADSSIAAYNSAGQTFHEHEARCQEARVQFEKACQEEKEAAQACAKRVLDSWAQMGNNPTAPAVIRCPQVPNATQVSEQRRGLTKVISCNLKIVEAGDKAIADRVSCSDLQSKLYEKAALDTKSGMKTNVTSKDLLNTEEKGIQDDKPRDSAEDVLDGSAKGQGKKALIKHGLNAAENLGIEGAQKLEGKISLAATAGAGGADAAGAELFDGTAGEIATKGLVTSASAVEKASALTGAADLAESMGLKVGSRLAIGPAAALVVASGDMTIAMMGTPSSCQTLNYDPYTAGKAGCGVSTGTALRIESAASTLRGN